MRFKRPTADTLRAEAKLLTVAGTMLLVIGFPLTILLVAQAMSPEGLSPVLPLAIGAPPIILGYLACRFASDRLMQARRMDGTRAEVWQPQIGSADG